MQLFDAALEDLVVLAQITGSKAHHVRSHPNSETTAEIPGSIPDVSPHLSRLVIYGVDILGRVASIDRCLWVESLRYSYALLGRNLLKLAAGDSGVLGIQRKLGDVTEDGGTHLGKAGPYHVQRCGFSSDCGVIASTGDKPATILALPLLLKDAVVSLGHLLLF